MLGRHTRKTKGGGACNATKNKGGGYKQQKHNSNFYRGLNQ
jgi:hypothetical protein